MLGAQITHELCSHNSSIRDTFLLIAPSIMHTLLRIVRDLGNSQISEQCFQACIEAIAALSKDKKAIAITTLPDYAESVILNVFAKDLLHYPKAEYQIAATTVIAAHYR